MIITALGVSSLTYSASNINVLKDIISNVKGRLYDNDHAGTVPEDLLSCFKVLKKCMNQFDCLVNEMLYIKQLTPSLSVQTDSIRAKVFV